MILATLLVGGALATDAPIAFSGHYPDCPLRFEDIQLFADAERSQSERADYPAEALSRSSVAGNFGDRLRGNAER